MEDDEEPYNVRLRNTVHETMLSNLLDNISTCDIVFVCGDGKTKAHKVIIFQAAPELLNLQCIGCRESHEDMVIVIPDIQRSILIHSLHELYLNGDASSLRKHLNFKNSIKSLGVDGSQTKVETFSPDEDDRAIKGNEELIVELYPGRHVESNMNYFEHSPSAKNRSKHEDSFSITDIEKDKCDSSRLNSLVELNEIDKVFVTGGEHLRDSDENLFHSNVKSELIEHSVDSYFVIRSEFENDLVAKEYMKTYNEIKHVNMVIANSGNCLLFKCHCGIKRKSESQGIRKVTSKYTGCPAFVRFYKRASGIVILTQFEESHNHDQSWGIPLRKNRVTFNWDSAADAIVRDGLLQGKNVGEIRDTIAREGLGPLPTPTAIHKRLKKVKNMLGLDENVEEKC